ncbi:hypothetical protein [Actinoplanes sp. NPDC023714]|uniref:hypothetical protein n=1 Tax=Actinoplanes sp. NPDC023714 TaxID=3154322 RepID=UPI0033DBD94D
MERTDLVVPADAIARLRIPPLAITDGAADPEWVEVPLSRWWFLTRRPSQRLPLDARSARSVRRATRLAPWSLPVALVSLIGWWLAYHANLTRAGLLAAMAAFFSVHLLGLVRDHGLPKHLPYRTRFGELRIPGVPAAVAQQWLARNPEVTATGEPAPRPHSRRFYIGWSTGLLAASIGIAATMANNGREDDILLWMLVPALFTAGIVAALRIPSPRSAGRVRTWPPVNVDRRVP